MTDFTIEQLDPDNPEDAEDISLMETIDILIDNGRVLLVEAEDPEEVIDAFCEVVPDEWYE